MTSSNAARKTGKATGNKPLSVVPGGKKHIGVSPLDPIIHQRMRLAIVSTLAVNKAPTFTEVKELLGMSDGNLSVHTQKLEEAGYINCKKTFEGRKPCSTFTLTRKGRAALERYLNHMESLAAALREK